MEKRTIVAMPGDGIGKVVLDEAIRVLGTAGFDANYVEGDTATIMAFVAIILATINVVGGFMVTNKMLQMIRGKKRGGK